MQPHNPWADLEIMGAALEPLPLPEDTFLLKPGRIEALPNQTLATHCYACGSLCGMTAKLKDGVLTGVGGLPGDIKGGGRLCPKGAGSPAHVSLRLPAQGSLD